MQLSRHVVPTAQYGPTAAPDNRVGDEQPTTDGGRVMWVLERAADYNSSPVIGRGSERCGW
jgi:hypothetical protein